MNSPDQELRSEPDTVEDSFVLTSNVVHELDPALPMEIAPARHGFLRRLASHIPAGQFVRYILVGGFNTVFGYTTFAIINYLLHHHRVPVSYLFAAAISNFLNITVAFLGYKFFVFRTKGNYLVEWLRAMAVYWSAFIPSLLLLPVLVRVITFLSRHGWLPLAGAVRAVSLHLPNLAHIVPPAEDLPPYVANAILILVGVGYSFIGHKKVTFRVQVEKSGAAVEPSTRL